MKRGFTLIELILAIIVIAVAVSGIPSLILSSAHSNEKILAQEVVTASKARLAGQAFQAYYAQQDSDSNIQVKTINECIQTPRTVYEIIDPKTIQAKSSSKIATTNAATDKNIIEAEFEIEGKYGSPTTFGNNKNDQIQYKITTEYTNSRGKTQKISMRSYAFNIGSPHYRQIPVE